MTALNFSVGFSSTFDAESDRSGSERCRSTVTCRSTATGATCKWLKFCKRRHDQVKFGCVLPQVNPSVLGGFLIKGESVVDSWLMPVYMAHQAIHAGAKVSVTVLQSSVYFA